MLAPALGYVFDPKWIWPHESIMSILWKLVLANRLPGHLVANQVNAKVDPYEGVPPSRAFVDVRRLADTLGISTRLLRRSLLAGSEHRQCCTSFRYCRLCSGLGYHSVLFQLPSESICPVHKVPLDTTCRTCGQATSYVINACIRSAVSLLLLQEALWQPVLNLESEAFPQGRANSDHSPRHRSGSRMRGLPRRFRRTAFQR
jgi:hypothetical protein